jgi:hypothetical protein
MAMELSCPGCGFVSQVSEEMQGHSVTCPKCGGPIHSGEVERVPCPYCSEKIVGGAKICRFCNSKLDPSTPGGRRSYCEWEDKSLGLFARYWKTWWNSLFEPNDFWSRVPADTPAKVPIRYAFMTFLQLWVLMAPFMILMGIIFCALPVEKGAEWVGPAILGGIVVYTLLLYPLTLLTVYFSSAIYHLFGRIVGIQGTFNDTLRIFCYSMGATYVGLIFGPLQMVAQIIMFVFGYKYLHRIGTGQAILLYFMPAMAFTLLFILLILVAVFFAV